MIFNTNISSSKGVTKLAMILTDVVLVKAAKTRAFYYTQQCLCMACLISTYFCMTSTNMAFSCRCTEYEGPVVISVDLQLLYSLGWCLAFELDIHRFTSKADKPLEDLYFLVNFHFKPTC